MEDNKTQPTTQQEQTTQPAAVDTTMAKNPNPRANENLGEEDRESAAANDVGSEITDGEAG